LILRAENRRAQGAHARERVGLLVAFFSCVASLVLAAAPPTAQSKVFASQNQALSEAFPDATRIDRKTMILRKAQVEAIESRTAGKIEAKIVVLHIAYREDEVLGYAHIDVHTVRTQPEAFLIVLTPQGRVRSVRILAFHEPLDYLPTDRWYGQFTDKGKEDGLRVGRDIHGVVGATLSARAAADGVRRMIAYYEVLLRPAEVAGSNS
jgi:Na+-translocating ferredoxin:NAD+ oxidoreductase RnfG subunit